MEQRRFHEISVRGADALRDGAWVEEARDRLASAGAVMLRTDVLDEDAAEIALGLVDPNLLEDAFWSTPRSRVAGKTLTATEYPGPRTILAHSEMSYMPVWPRLIAFHSIEVASEGGETTVGDLAAISRDIGHDIEAFAKLGVAYRRTYQKGIDVDWRTAFQTDDRAEVEAVGRAFGMSAEWIGADVLVATHKCQGAVADENGDWLYFNQAHLFHPSSLGADMRSKLERAVGADRLPRQASYGDGSPIADDTLERVRTAIESNLGRVCWRPGDILILDNMRFVHGRRPFTGSRKLHVALARPESGSARQPLSFESAA